MWRCGVGILVRKVIIFLACSRYKLNFGCQRLFFFFFFFFFLSVFDKIIIENYILLV